MAWVGSVISATSIFVACAGINSSVTSVVGGSNSSLAGIVKPWFTPLEAKDSIKKQEVALTETSQHLKQVEKDNTELSQVVAATSIAPSENSDETGMVDSPLNQVSDRTDSIIAASTFDQAKQLLDRGTTQFTIKIPSTTSGTKTQTITATNATELQRKIDYYAKVNRGWYVIAASASSEDALQDKLKQLQNDIPRYGTRIRSICGVLPRPVIWPPSPQDTKPLYKLVTIFGIKDKDDAVEVVELLRTVGLPTESLAQR